MTAYQGSSEVSRVDGSIGGHADAAVLFDKRLVQIECTHSVGRIWRMRTGKNPETVHKRATFEKNLPLIRQVEFVNDLHPVNVLFERTMANIIINLLAGSNKMEAHRCLVEEILIRIRNCMNKARYGNAIWECVVPELISCGELMDGLAS